MSNESISSKSASNPDIWYRIYWLFGIGGSLVMVYTEYAFLRFASLNQLAMGQWCRIGLAIASPWILCLACLSILREHMNKEGGDRAFCLEVSVWVEMVMLSAYWMLNELQHFRSWK